MLTGCRLLAPCSGALLVVACRNGQPAPAPASSVLAPPPAVRTATPPARAPESAVDAGQPMSLAAFDGPHVDKRVFRQLEVGAIRAVPSRMTWFFDRLHGEARLRVLCQLGNSGSTGITLRGDEDDDARWDAPVETTYVGFQSGDSYTMTAVGGAVDVTDCEAMPATLKVACEDAVVPVLSAGALLLRGKQRSDGSSSPAHWQPGKREQVRAERCEVTGKSVTQEWKLVFPKAPGRGVEWVFVNSDTLLQEGAHRWMPASNAAAR